MNLKRQTSLLAILFAGFGSLAQAPEANPGQPIAPKTAPPLSDIAAEKPAIDVSDARPDFATVQRELEGLSPEERRARLTEYRKKYGAKNARSVKAPQQISAEEWKAYAPEQKRLLLQTWQANHQSGQLTPEQRQEQLRLIRANLDSQVQSLQIRKKTGMLTDRETELLKQLQVQQRRMNDRQIEAPHYQGRTTVAPPDISR